MKATFQRLFQRRTTAAGRAAMLEVLNETKRLLARPENDFAWSSWASAADALKEIDALIETIDRGEKPERIAISVLFAPTGPIQEVSVSSGWGDEFPVVAERFDRALSAL